MKIRIKRLREHAALPRYMTTHAAGMDLSSALDDVLELAPGKRALVALRFAIAIPEGYEGK